MAQDSYDWVKLRSAEPYEIAVEHDRDRMLGEPGHEYITTSPIRKVPAPPLAGTQTCAGRYRWGQQAVIGGVDAGDTLAQVALTAGRKVVTVEGARVVHDRAPAPPLTGSWLHCPPEGGPREIRQLKADLDTGKVEFVESSGEAVDDGRRRPLLLDVEPGGRSRFRCLPKQSDACAPGGSSSTCGSMANSRP